jgi:hypothetical protein
MVKAGPVSLYHFSQDVLLGIELDSFVENGFHGFYLLSLSFGPKITSKAIVNNQCNDEYEMGESRLWGSAYLAFEIGVCPMGHGEMVESSGFVDIVKKIFPGLTEILVTSKSS